MNRYQVYLNPQSVATIDEVASMSSFTRSRIIQEAVDAVAGRFGNLLAVITTRTPSHYSEIDKLVGAIGSGSKKVTYSSTRVDDIYYDR